MREGKFILCGVEHYCSIRNGKQFVDGVSVDDFLSTLVPKELIELAQLGQKVANNDLRSGSPQATLNAIHSKENVN